jgi:hypothetical protein
MWIFGRPLGARQLHGFCLPLWSMIIDPVAEDVWQRNLAIVATELAKDGGRAIACP